ncbi:MAG: DUF3995 domain-containing protein [Dehalococcoidia bacterium]|nr:DUF3995 domain-containing protein [Dehalococcoidia bacterium]
MNTGARCQSSSWPGYCAAVWAFLFALPSFYWAAGGEAGSGTIAAEIDEVTGGQAWLVALTGVFKVAAGLLTLALVQPWGLRLPRGPLLATVWLVGVGFTLYGLLNFLDHLLMVSGLRETPEALGETAARWHLLFWDPWWLLGGALFSLATWRYQRRSRP